MTVFGSYSNYYNLFYRDKDYLGETTYVHELINKYRPGARNLLDLGCGTGQHASLFARQGYRVLGVDRSAEMLNAAREKADAGPAEISYQCGDIREIRLKRRFDVVVSLFHVISYQPDNRDLQAAFATVRDHLAPGGVFIFDCWYGPAVLTVRPEIRVKRFEDEQSTVTRRVEPVMHPNENLVDLHYELLVRSKDSGATEEIREVHRMRYLFRPEIELMLKEASMSLVEASEWMTGKPLGFDTWGGCFVAQKEQ